MSYQQMRSMIAKRIWASRARLHRHKDYVSRLIASDTGYFNGVIDCYVRHCQPGTYQSAFPTLQQAVRVTAYYRNY